MNFGSFIRNGIRYNCVYHQRSKNRKGFLVTYKKDNPLAGSFHNAEDYTRVKAKYILQFQDPYHRESTIPSNVASMITEDPDVFMELTQSITSSIPQIDSPTDATEDPTLDLDKQEPLNMAEIERQAEEETPDAAEPEEIDQIKLRKELEAQEQEKRRSTLDPQLRDMEKSLNTMRLSTKHGKPGDVGREIANLTQAVNMFDKQL